MNKLSRNFLIFFILLLLVLLLLGSYGLYNKERFISDLNKVENYKDSVKQYKNSLNELIEYNNSLEIDVRDLKFTRDSLYNYINTLELSKISTVTEVRTITKIDSIPYIVFVDTNNIDTTFNIYDDNYTISGKVDNKGLYLSNIIIPNEVILVEGERRKGWFRRKESILTVKNTNPLVYNTGIRNYVVKDKDGRVSLGLFIGYGGYLDLVNNRSGHGISGGLSLNYSLIKF